MAKMDGMTFVEAIHYKPTEYEALQGITRDVPPKMISLDAENFWEFVTSDDWLHYETLRICDGQLLRTILASLADLVKDGQVKTQKSCEYETITKTYASTSLYTYPMKYTTNSNSNNNQNEFIVKIKHTTYLDAAKVNKNNGLVTDTANQTKDIVDPSTLVASSKTLDKSSNLLSSEVTDSMPSATMEYLFKELIVVDYVRYSVKVINIPKRDQNSLLQKTVEESERGKAPSTSTGPKHTVEESEREKAASQSTGPKQSTVAESDPSNESHQVNSLNTPTDLTLGSHTGGGKISKERVNKSQSDIAETSNQSNNLSQHNNTNSLKVHCRSAAQFSGKNLSICKDDYYIRFIIKDSARDVSFSRPVIATKFQEPEPESTDKATVTIHPHKLSDLATGKHRTTKGSYVKLGDIIPKNVASESPVKEGPDYESYKQYLNIVETGKRRKSMAQRHSLNVDEYLDSLKLFGITDPELDETFDMLDGRVRQLKKNFDKYSRYENRDEVIVLGKNKKLSVLKHSFEPIKPQFINGRENIRKLERVRKPAPKVDSPSCLPVSKDEDSLPEEFKEQLVKLCTQYVVRKEDFEYISREWATDSMLTITRRFPFVITY